MKTKKFVKVPSLGKEDMKNVKGGKINPIHIMYGIPPFDPIDPNDPIDVKPLYGIDPGDQVRPLYGVEPPKDLM